MRQDAKITKIHWGDTRDWTIEYNGICSARPGCDWVDNEWEWKKGMRVSHQAGSRHKQLYALLGTIVCSLI